MGNLAVTDVLLELLGFLSSFLILGAVGFRVAVVRRAASVGDGVEAMAYGRSVAWAALLGAVGAGLGVASMVANLVKRGAQKNQSLEEAFSAGGLGNILQLVLLGVMLLAFILAALRIGAAFWVAALAALAFALRGVVNGNVGQMVNPLHVLGASLWIGSLLVLVVSGIGAMMRAPTEPRERAVALMVKRFSLLALPSAALLGVTGLITAWTHVHGDLELLWTTAYGQVLLVKLGLVALVLGLGAWNWRRVGPALGKDGGARRIRGSALTELGFAALVLVATGVLVSTPSPKAKPAAEPPAKAAGSGEG